jgi:mycothiol synthase
MDVEVLRRVSPENLQAVQDLLDAVTAHDGHTALGEHKWIDLVHGGREGYAGVVAREAGHDHPVGYAHLSRRGAQWTLEVVVHPEHRGVGVEVALVDRALEVARTDGGGHLHWWVFQPTEIHEALAHRFGLRRGREILQMRVPLPPVDEPRFAPGTDVRTFDPERDTDAWLEVNNAAFAHHPEQGSWTRQTLADRMRESWFDPDGFLLAFDDGGMAGFCWTKIHPDSGFGEIYVIGVEPSRHGTGLGKALVLAGLHSLAERGATTGMLYVDATNEPAVGLYRKLGFTVDHLDRAYVTDVAP